MNKLWIMGVIAVIIGFFGFKFVTQAGQAMGVPQNDGYAVSGGIMLLLAGIIEGHVLGEVYTLGEKSKRENSKK